MKVLTLTLNPAIDQTVRVDGFRAGTVNRGQSMQFDAGGKGVNVASFLADAGVATGVTGFLGEDNVALFEQFFASKGIADRFVRLPGSTRIGVKIVDEAGQHTTDINMPGLAPTPAHLDALCADLVAAASTCAWVVLAGNVPPGIPHDIYASLIPRLRAVGCQVALDTSGPALEAGLRAGPTLAKPNNDELAQMLGRPLETLADLEQAGQTLLGGGIETLAISMGAQGALVLEAGETWHAAPPRVQVRSTVGAGDAMVAGLIAGALRGLALAERARLATAFSVGAITRLGAHLPPADEFDQYLAGVVVQPVHHSVSG